MSHQTLLYPVGQFSLLAFGLLLTQPVSVVAHCDSLDGPVVITAQRALDKGDVSPVLKWVQKEYEEEVKMLSCKLLSSES